MDASSLLVIFKAIVGKSQGTGQQLTQIMKSELPLFVEDVKD